MTNNISSVCKSYFEGFHDISSFKKNETSKTLLGVLKIISYMTVVIPLFFGIVYGVSSLVGRVTSIKNPSSTTQNTSLAAQQILKINPPKGIFELYQTKEINQALSDVEQLSKLSNDPSWENYQDLSKELKYLIAGRYTFSKDMLWNFRSKEALIDLFNDAFKSSADLQGALSDIKEAAKKQKKILFVECFKELVKDKKDLNLAKSQDGEAFKQCMEYIADENNCELSDPVAYAKSVLNNVAADFSKIEKALNKFITDLKKTHLLM